LIIKPGGRVELYGKLTSCSNEWLGVDMESGNTFSYFNSWDGATIQNAHDGIAAIHADNARIRCIGTSFINNQTSLREVHKKSKNTSIFYKCQFVVDDSYSIAMDDLAQVNIIGKKSFYFEGCKFLNSRKTSGSFGILARGALLTVSDYCSVAVPAPLKCPAKYVT